MGREGAWQSWFPSSKKLQLCFWQLQSVRGIAVGQFSAGHSVGNCNNDCNCCNEAWGS